MTYPIVAPGDPTTAAAPAHFLYVDRIVLLAGAAGVGAGAGFLGAIIMGRQDLWMQLFIAAPVLAAALCMACATFKEARLRRTRGCDAMAACHGIVLIAWPLFMPLQTAAYWVAPSLALTSALALGACWSGLPGAIYRAAGQTLLVAALTAYQGALLVLGG